MAILGFLFYLSSACPGLEKFPITGTFHGIRMEFTLEKDESLL